MINKRLRCLALLLYILLSLKNVFSQTLINSTGSILQNSNISVEYSVGEISISTLASNQNYITQGLLQPMPTLFKDCNLLHFIPNAFTPNNDHLNDCFWLKNWPASTSFELCIYNRSGQLVFKTTNILECWNGEFKGQAQPTDTYVYTINANTSSCGLITSKGTITLIR